MAAREGLGRRAGQPLAILRWSTLEATFAVLTVGESSRTIKRLLRMWLTPPPPRIFLTAWPDSAQTPWSLPTSYRECKGLRAGRLDKHSMHLLDWESCVTRDVPTRWRRSASSTVTTRAGWPPGDDHRSRVRASLSLPLHRGRRLRSPDRESPAAWGCGAPTS